MLLRSWPPLRSPFNVDRDATDEVHDGIPVRVASAVAGQLSFDRWREYGRQLGTKPRADVAASMLRAPVAEVLKLRCAACHGLAGFFVTWQAAATLEEILAEGRWLPSSLPKSCACQWATWPDARGFRQQLGTALARGLAEGRVGVKVEAVPR